MADALAFELVGGWTSPHLLLRLLMLGDPPWEPLRTGYTHRDTGERVVLAMGPPQPALADAIAAGVDPARPTLDEDLLESVLQHRSVVVVSDPSGDAPVARASTLLRAAGQIVNAGALAARCRTSGLSHGADGLHALVRALDDAEGGPGGTEAPDPLAVLVQAYVRFDVSPEVRRTWGMHALGAPDVVLGPDPGPERARARLEAEVTAVLRATARHAVRPDPGAAASPLFNRFGQCVVD